MSRHQPQCDQSKGLNPFSRKLLLVGFDALPRRGQGPPQPSAHRGGNAASLRGGSCTASKRRA
jgi:hypothetical protein